jgi:hypothetical protein
MKLTNKQIEVLSRIIKEKAEKKKEEFLKSEEYALFREEFIANNRGYELLFEKYSKLDTLLAETNQIKDEIRCLAKETIGNTSYMPTASNVEKKIQEAAGISDTSVRKIEERILISGINSSDNIIDDVLSDLGFD